MPHSRKNAATYFLCRIRQEQGRICNVSWPLLQSTLEGIQQATFIAYGWAKRLNSTTTIKIQINNSVVGLMGDFCSLVSHMLFFFFFSEAAFALFVFSFTPLLSLSLCSLQGGDCRTMKVWQYHPQKHSSSSQPVLHSSTPFAAFMQVPADFCRGAVCYAAPKQISALTNHKCTYKCSVRL